MDADNDDVGAERNYKRLVRAKNKTENEGVAEGILILLPKNALRIHRNQ